MRSVVVAVLCALCWMSVDAQERQGVLPVNQLPGSSGSAEVKTPDAVAATATPATTPTQAAGQSAEAAVAPVPATSTPDVEKKETAEKPALQQESPQASEAAQPLMAPEKKEEAAVQPKTEQTTVQAPAQEKAAATKLPEAPKTTAPVTRAPEITQAPKAEELEAEGEVGFDTVGLEEPEGNWLIKRIWWEKAEARYEKIKNQIDQILDLRMKFFNERNEVENKILDPFYIEQALNHGQIDEIVAFLLDELKQERDKNKGLSPQERQLYETLVAEQTNLEQLKKDIEEIRKLDVDLDEALTKLMEQINLCRKYEKQAWNDFKEIAKVLDHNKARALYMGMDTYLKNVKNISEYIQNPFTQYFNGKVAKIKENVARIKSSLAALKEKGIDLKQQALKLAEQERALACPVPTEPEKPAEEEEEEAPQGWVGWAWSGITDFLSSVWDMIAFWK